MTLNAEKTVIMNNRLRKTYGDPLVLNGYYILTTSIVKSLGVLLNNHQNFTSNVNLMIKKSN